MFNNQTTILVTNYNNDKGRQLELNSNTRTPMAETGVQIAATVEIN